MVTLALEGPASYRDRHELVFRHRAERPNALWQVDHTELDILIAGAGGKPERPWLTTVMDDYSRAICGYMVFEGAPSAMNTALALRQAIWPKSDPAWPMCGIPDLLYVDHGSDFTSDHLARTGPDRAAALLASHAGLAANPRTARQVDTAPLREAHRQLVEYLRPLGSRRRFTDGLLHVGAAVALGLLVVGALAVWLMVRRGAL